MFTQGEHCLPMDGRSVVSDTDRMMFTVLSNADRVDLHQVHAGASSPTPRIEEVATAPVPEAMDTRRAETFPRPPSPPRTAVLPSVPEHQETVAYPAAPAAPAPAPFEAAPTPAPFEAVPTPAPFEAVPTPAPFEAVPTPAPFFEVPPLPSFAAPIENPFGTANAPTSAPEERRHSSDDDTKRTLLLDLQQLEKQGVRLSKQWTMDDPLEDMMLEMRRHSLAMDESANVTMMRDGLKLALTGIEMVNNRFHLLDLEGWSSTVCKDLSKHDANLARIYRKWWKRPTSTSPEMDICLSLMGSMGMHHMKRTMSKQLLSQASGSRARSAPKRSDRRRAPTPPSSDDEEAPPPKT